MIYLQSIPSFVPSAGKENRRRQLVHLSGLILILLLCGCAAEAPWKKQAFALACPSGETGTGTSAHTNFLSLHRVTVSPLFEGKALVYRTGENSYEQDPYAEFLIPPNQMFKECLQLSLRQGHAFAAVLDADSGMHASCCMAVSVNQLYGDFRQPNQPFALLQMSFLLYSILPADHGRVIWQQVYYKSSPIAQRTAATVFAGWNTGLQEIMDQVNSELNQLVISETRPAIKIP